MNLLFIVNPIAGSGARSALNAIGDIISYCTENKIDYTIQKTSYKGHATLMAREAINSPKNYDAVVSVGGDGTLLEVANGLIGSDILLGVLPAGTGNDFARTIGIPTNINDALGFLVSKQSRLIDIASLEDMFFVNVASVGFDAEIARDILKIKRFIPGKASYYAAALIKFFAFKFKDVAITLDKKRIKAKVLLVAIANGNYYGGGMKVNPNGVIEDGYLDVIVVHRFPRYKLPFLFLKFIQGTHLEFPFVEIHRCKEIKIDSKDSLVINADGEILGETPAKFSIKPLSLNVIAG